MKSIYLSQKFFLSTSIGALALLIVTFVAYDSYLLAVVLGPFYKWIMVFQALLVIYFIFSLIRAVVLLKSSLQKAYYYYAIIVSVLALFTFFVDQSMLSSVVELYQDGFGFRGEQRMLLVSLLIKFIALIVVSLAAIKNE